MCRRFISPKYVATFYTWDWDKIDVQRNGIPNIQPFVLCVCVSARRTTITRYGIKAANVVVSIKIGICVFKSDMRNFSHHPHATSMDRLSSFALFYFTPSFICSFHFLLTSDFHFMPWRLTLEFVGTFVITEASILVLPLK